MLYCQARNPLSLLTIFCVNKLFDTLKVKRLKHGLYILLPVSMTFRYLFFSPSHLAFRCRPVLEWFLAILSTALTEPINKGSAVLTLIIHRLVTALKTSSLFLDHHHFGKL